MADLHAHRGQPVAAIKSLQQAAALAEHIQYQPIYDYAQARIAELQGNGSPGWVQGLQHFAQRERWQYGLVFGLSIVAVPVMLVLGAIGAVVQWLLRRPQSPS